MSIFVHNIFVALLFRATDFFDVHVFVATEPDEVPGKLWGDSQHKYHSHVKMDSTFKGNKCVNYFAFKQMK